MNIIKAFSVVCLMVGSFSVSKKINIVTQISRKLIPIKYDPKTPNQKTYKQFLKDVETLMVFVTGPAGTGKTLFACITAIDYLNTGLTDKIVITRPIVPVEDEELGFLPGNINKKMDPWTRPLFDIFLQYYSQKELDIMVRDGIVEISPLGFMRGRTFTNAFVIADEMQNSTPNQMKMLTTRIGLGSKMVITGDPKQSDRGLNSGLTDFITRFKIHQSHCHSLQKSQIKIVHLNETDVQRSPLVTEVLHVYGD